MAALARELEGLVAAALVELIMEMEPPEPQILVAVAVVGRTILEAELKAAQAVPAS